MDGLPLKTARSKVAEEPGASVEEECGPEVHDLVFDFVDEDGEEEVRFCVEPQE